MRKIFQSEKLRLYFESNLFSRYFVRRQALQTFDLMAGFVYSQILLSCVKLNLFSFLIDEPKHLDTLSKFLNLDKPQFDCLINGACAIGLIEQDNNFLVDLSLKGHIFAHNKGLTALILHHEIFYRDLTEPVTFLKNNDVETSLNKYWDYTERKGCDVYNISTNKNENAKRYSELMSISQPLVTDQVFSAYNFDRHSSILDVGGGKASFSIRIAKIFPRLKVIANLDLPNVCEEAEKNIATENLSKRIRVIPSNFFEEEIPHGYDLVTLIRVLYDHSEENVVKLLKSIRGSLSDGGRLLVAEPMAASTKSRISCDAYFWFYLTVMGKGKPRRAEELIELMRMSGFSKARCLKATLPIQTGIILAEA